MPEEENLKDLVNKAKKYSEDFGKLYDLVFPKLFQFVIWRIGNKEDAEDLVSEIFMKILKNIEKFQWRGDAFFWGWVFRIARNSIINFAKKKSKHSSADIDDLPEVKAPIINEEERIQDKVEVEALRKLIDEMPKRQSEILVMHYFSELRNKEIAEVLEIGEKSVAGTLTRARRKLYDMYCEKSSLQMSTG